MYTDKEEYRDTDRRDHLSKARKFTRMLFPALHSAELYLANSLEKP
jgi:hypothetical protein